MKKLNRKAASVPADDRNSEKMGPQEMGGLLAFYGDSSILSIEYVYEIMVFVIICSLVSLIY